MLSAKDEISRKLTESYVLSNWPRVLEKILTSNPFFGLKTALHKKPELVESTIHPLLSEAQNVIMEDLKEIEEQMDKQVGRLQELKILRTQQPGELFLVPDF